MLTKIKANLDDYSKDKKWWPYLLFWLFGLYLFVKLLDFKLTEPAPSVFIMVAQSLDFFIHEMAHLLLAAFGYTAALLAGSGSELLLGLVLIVTAFWTKSYFASLFCFLWFMLACLATADYMADAQAMAMDLVSFGGPDPIHDWNAIFTKFGVLEHYRTIANLTRFIGIASGSFGLGLSGYLLVKIYFNHRDAKHQARMDKIMSEVAAKRPEERKDLPFSSSLYPEANKGSLAERDPKKTSKT